MAAVAVCTIRPGVVRAFAGVGAKDIARDAAAAAIDVAARAGQVGGTNVTCSSLAFRLEVQTHSVVDVGHAIDHGASVDDDGRQAI